MSAGLVLALVWWLAFGGLGLIFPYYSLYLSENAGLEGSEVGLVMAMLPLMGLLAQPLWGQLADRTGLRSRVLTALLAGTSVGYLALAGIQSFAGFVLATAALAVFSTAIVPSCVAVTLASLPGEARFGRARVMGTLGFGVSVVSFPFLLQGLRAVGLAPASPPLPGRGEVGLELIFWLAAGLLALAAGVSAALPTRGLAPLQARRGEWRGLFARPAFVRALVFAFLAFLINQGPMVLFPILVRDQGGGVEVIGRMWVLMLALEIPLVYHFGATISRLGARGVVAVGVAAAAIRWAVSGFADDLLWVYAAQLLHGITVWGIVLGLPLYVDGTVPPQLRSTAQGLLAMLGISLGSIFSNLGTGWIMDVWGPRAPAQLASAAGLALALALPWMLPALPGRGSAPSRADPSGAVGAPLARPSADQR